MSIRDSNDPLLECTLSKKNVCTSTSLVNMSASHQDYLTGNNGTRASSLTRAVAAILKERGLEEGSVANLLLSTDLDLFLRIETVTALIGLSVPTVYRLMAKGDFPRPVKLTAAARGWQLSEIIGWMQSRAGDADDRAERVQP